MLTSASVPLDDTEDSAQVKLSAAGLEHSFPGWAVNRRHDCGLIASINFMFERVRSALVRPILPIILAEIAMDLSCCVWITTLCNP